MIFVCLFISVTFSVNSKATWSFGLTFTIRLLLLFAHQVQSIFYLGHCSLVMSVQALCGADCRLLPKNSVPPHTASTGMHSHATSALPLNTDVLCPYLVNKWDFVFACRFTFHSARLKLRAQPQNSGQLRVIWPTSDTKLSEKLVFWQGSIWILLVTLLTSLLLLEWHNCCVSGKSLTPECVHIQDRGAWFHWATLVSVSAWNYK